MNQVALHPLKKTDVKVGFPLPWPVYNQKRQLLLREGFVIESMNQLELLLGSGLFRPRDVKGTDPFVSNPEINREKKPVTQTPGAIPHAEMVSIPFCETGLTPGTAIQLVSEHATTDRLIVRLIGYLDKKSLIVTHPENHGHASYVKDGTGFDCNAFHGKRVFQFRATAIRSHMQPYPYLHLTCPEKVSSMTVRGSHRIRTQIIAAISFANSAASSPCTIRDLGLTGLQIHMSPSPCEKGAEVQIAFRLNIDDEKVLFEVPARVQRVQKTQSDAGFESLELGVQFLELPLDKRRLLEIYLYRGLLAGTDPKG
jgi:c-di-GMP-binding flagellar brake protein YcgR